MNIRKSLSALEEQVSSDSLYWIKAEYAKRAIKLNAIVSKRFAFNHFLTAESMSLLYPNNDFYRRLRRTEVRGQVNGSRRRHLLGQTRVKRVIGYDMYYNAIVPYSEPGVFMTEVPDDYRKHQKRVILIRKGKDPEPDYDTGEFVVFAVTDVGKNVLLSKIHRKAIEGIDMVLYDSRVKRMILLHYLDLTDRGVSYSSGIVYNIPEERHNLWKLRYVSRKNPEGLKRMGFPEERIIYLNLGGDWYLPRLFELPQKEPGELDSIIENHVGENDLLPCWEMSLQ